MVLNAQITIETDKSINSGGWPQQRLPRPHILTRLEPQTLRHDNSFTLCHAPNWKAKSAHIIDYPLTCRLLHPPTTITTEWVTGESSCAAGKRAHEICNDIWVHCESVRRAALQSRCLSLATQESRVVHALSKHSLILIVLKSKWFHCDYFEFMVLQADSIHPPAMHWQMRSVEQQKVV